jgi:UDP-N-acetylmuramate--alanine ligase
MHIYFSGIGAGTGPLALLAHQAGYKVSGSDKQDNEYLKYLSARGVNNIHIGQTTEQIRKVHESDKIDWFVYSSAVIKENSNHPEFIFANNEGLRTSKRDELIKKIVSDSGQKMIAVAGTHGKTTTTAMIIWMFKQLRIPISYSVGGKLSFGDIAEFNKSAEFFIYEADEYDRNFLSFNPEIAIISGIGYDHADIYPTPKIYRQAFIQFFKQSKLVRLWGWDYKALLINSGELDNLKVEPELTNLDRVKLAGKVNRENAQLVIKTLCGLGLCTPEQAVKIINKFPGVYRRFEKIAENIYSDYAHTPEKILGALELAHEVTGDNMVVIYEGLHNTRQHFIKKELETLFSGVKRLYIVPSYLAREDESLEMLTPEKLCRIIKDPSPCIPATLDANLKSEILNLATAGNLILCLTAGGGGSLDEWLRREFS